MIPKIVKTVEFVYGNYTVVCGVTEDSSLVIATPTIENLLGYEPDTGRKKLASKSFKAFAGNALNLAKFTAIVPGLGQGKTNFYSMEVFQKLLKWELSVKKNDQAIALVVAGFLDSFSEFAFNELEIALTRETRQCWLNERQGTKDTFHVMTDELKGAGFKSGVDYAKFIKVMQETKLGFKCGTRDILSFDQLVRLSVVQAQIAGYIRAGFTPWQALKMVR